MADPDRRLRDALERKLDFEFCYCQAVRSMKQEDAHGRLVEVAPQDVLDNVAANIALAISRGLQAATQAAQWHEIADAFIAELERD